MRWDKLKYQRRSSINITVYTMKCIRALYLRFDKRSGIRIRLLIQRTQLNAEHYRGYKKYQAPTHTCPKAILWTKNIAHFNYPNESSLRKFGRKIIVVNDIQMDPKLCCNRQRGSHCMRLTLAHIVRFVLGYLWSNVPRTRRLGE